MKSENSSPRASPSSTRTNTYRTTPQAISEGRRLYVGNMPYTAKSEDVEALFTAAEFAMYATPNTKHVCARPEHPRGDVNHKFP